MKKFILTSIFLLTIISLDAQEVTDKFSLGFTNVEIFHKEISPAFKIDSKISEFIEFTFIYANNLTKKSLFKRPINVENPKAQTLYLSMNYRF